MSHRLTAEELDAAACEWAERTALAQGLPAKIEDPVALDKIAALLYPTSSRRTLPAGGRTAATPRSPSGSPPRGPTPPVAAGEGEARSPRPAA